MEKSAHPIRSGSGVPWVRQGGLWLNPALAFLISAWVTHGLLRAAELFRKDAFGFPFVGKPDWYIFHALAIDAQWILAWSLPFLILLFICGARGWRGLGQAAMALLMAFHGVVLLFTVCDQETMRFMGMHLDLSTLLTYGNGSALYEVPAFVASDLSVRYVPYILFAACVPFALGFYLAYLRRRSWARQQALHPRLLASVALAWVAAFVFVNFIWPGGFRMLKLRPFVIGLVDNIQHQKPPPADAREIRRLGSVFQKQWLREQGDGGFVFPDSSHPFYKAPLEFLCAHHPPDSLAARCAEDKDGDGFPASRDCDDGDSTVHPGAADLSGDGVDQDCDGMDAAPKNFVIILMESHRGVNVGYLKPYGAEADATPVFDSLAAGKAHAWTRFSCSGIPTINALMSVHLSILQHPTRYIASDFATLRQHAFTEILGQHGYRTHFFSAADPAWDGQTRWIRQWYQGMTYDRKREADGDMLENMAQWMKDSLRADKPFLVTAMTKSNHYPFNPEAGMRALSAGASLQDKMVETMRYTDANVGRFLHAIQGQPWFKNTVVIMLADHGFPLSEHGSSTIGYGLYTESMWIPFLMLGDAPKMGAPALHDYPACQLDIGPTVLDLAGIRTPNHFLGHSLFRAATGRNSLSYLVRAEQGTLETQGYRIHGALGARPREQGDEVFNTDSDRLETRNLLASSGRAVFDSLLPFLRDMAALNTHLVETDALWPDSSAARR